MSIEHFSILLLGPRNKSGEDRDSDNDSEILRRQINFNDGDDNSDLDDAEKWKKSRESVFYFIDGEDDENKEKLAKCMMRHNSKFRLRWDLLVILLTLYN